MDCDFFGRLCQAIKHPTFRPLQTEGCSTRTLTCGDCNPQTSCTEFWWPCHWISSVVPGTPALRVFFYLYVHAIPAVDILRRPSSLSLLSASHSLVRRYLHRKCAWRCSIYHDHSGSPCGSQQRKLLAGVAAFRGNLASLQVFYPERGRVSWGPRRKQGWVGGNYDRHVMATKLQVQ